MELNIHDMVIWYYNIRNKLKLSREKLHPPSRQPNLVHHYAQNLPTAKGLTLLLFQLPMNTYQMRYCDAKTKTVRQHQPPPSIANPPLKALCRVQNLHV